MWNCQETWKVEPGIKGASTHARPPYNQRLIKKARVHQLILGIVVSPNPEPFTLWEQLCEGAAWRNPKGRTLEFPFGFRVKDLGFRCLPWEYAAQDKFFAPLF